MSSISKVNRPRAMLLGRRTLVRDVAGGDARMTWVGAPAGSGKTSLGLELAAAHPGPVAWLRLDETDADLASFFHFLAEAVRSGGVAADWQAPQLVREHLSAPAVYVRAFVRSLAGAVAADACLVFDDTHRCQEAPFFGPLQSTLAEEMPHGTRVLCLSRLPPPVQSTRLVVNGQMREMTGADLHFSAAETEALLAAIGVPRNPDTTTTVGRLTHGWAAGIAMVGAWMQRRPGETPAWDLDLARSVAGYLASEVFGTFTPLERKSLLSVCWLSNFNAEDVSFLAGDPGAAGAVAGLVTRGIMVFEYPGRTFGLHHLFQRYLQQEAAASLPREEADALRGRSVDRLEAQGNLDEAVELALESGAFARAAGMVEKLAVGALAQARHHTVRRWITRLPEAFRTTWLRYWLGMATLISSVPEARGMLIEAYRAFVAEGNQEQRFVALSSIIGSYFLNATGAEPLRDFIAREMGGHGDYERVADPALRAHLAFSVFSALFTTDPSHPDLPLWEERTFVLLHDYPDPFLTIRSAIMLAQHAFLGGRYKRIGEVRAALDAHPVIANAPPYARYMAFAVSLYDDLVRFDHGALAAGFAASRACAEETGARIMDGHYALDLASDAILRGEMRQAAAILEGVAAKTPPEHYNLAGHLHMIQAWAAARNGDPARLRAHAALLAQAAEGFCCVGYRVAAQVAEAIADVLEGGTDGISAPAAPKLSCDDFPFPLPRIHAGLLAASVALGRGDREACLASLAVALPLWARESPGYLTFAVPKILAPLCAEALEASIEPDFVRRVVSAHDLSAPANAGPGWPWPLTIRCFGGFELRVDGAPLPARGKSKHRQLDLLRLLAGHAPAPLPLARVAESLWPDSEGDAAHHALETTLSRLRSTLPPGLVRLEHGLLGLDPAVCWSDTAQLARLLPVLEGAEGDRLAGLVRQVLVLYRGELLAGQDAAWILAEREAWRGRIARHVGDAARRLADGGRAEPGAELLRWALDTDPHNELLLLAFLRLCARHGYPSLGLVAYRRFRRLAHRALAASVAEEVESLARSLQTGAP